MAKELKCEIDGCGSPALFGLYVTSSHNGSMKLVKRFMRVCSSHERIYAEENLARLTEKEKANADTARTDNHR